MSNEDIKRCSKFINEAIKHPRSVKEIATTFYNAGLITKKEYNGFIMSK